MILAENGKVEEAEEVAVLEVGALVQTLTGIMVIMPLLIQVEVEVGLLVVLVVLTHLRLVVMADQE